MPYILLVCQIILAAILLIAAFGKVRYTQQLVMALRVSAIPQFFVFPVAIIIITLETELALGLVLSIRGTLPFVFGGTFLLLGAFTGWLVSVYRRQLNVECGCFGASRAKECFFLFHWIKMMLHQTIARHNSNAHGKKSVNLPPSKKLIKTTVLINRL